MVAKKAPDMTYDPDDILTDEQARSLSAVLLHAVPGKVDLLLSYWHGSSHD